MVLYFPEFRRITGMRRRKHMKNISLQSIKWDSVRSIFNIIAEKDAVSRAEISEKTALSLVTVGKVADALLDMNIICQAKEIKNCAGRRAGLLSVNENNFSVILDLTRRCFWGVMLNLRFNFMEKILFSYNPEFSYIENLQAFLAEVSRNITKNHDITNCCGIGVSVPSTYNPLTDTVESSKICELNSVKLREMIRKYFSGLPICIDSSVNAAAVSNISQISNYKEKNILYWFISEDTASGAFVVKGEVILGRDNHFCDFGNVRDVYGRSLSEKITCSDSAADYARIIALDTANIIRILAPHTIIIECDLRGENPEENRNTLIAELTGHLINEHEFTPESLPEFIGTGCKIRHSHRGIAMKLREMWIDQMIQNT